MPRPNAVQRPHSNRRRAATVASAAAQPLDRPRQRVCDATSAARPRTHTPSPNASAARGAATARQKTPRRNRRDRGRARPPATPQPHVRPRPCGNKIRAPADASAPAKRLHRPPHRVRAAEDAAHPPTRSPSPNDLTSRGAETARQQTPRDRGRARPPTMPWPQVEPRPYGNKSRAPATRLPLPNDSAAHTAETARQQTPRDHRGARPLQPP